MGNNPCQGMSGGMGVPPVSVHSPGGLVYVPCEGARHYARGERGTLRMHRKHSCLHRFLDYFARHFHTPAMRALFVFLFLAIFPALLQAEVSLPNLFSRGMVLQRSTATPVWGQAAAGEKVTVRLADQSAVAQANADGRWQVALDISKVGPGPFALIVQGENILNIPDVLVGEVWLASGQSNMSWPVKLSLGAQEDLAASGNNRLRMFTVQRTAAASPAADVVGKWESASPDTSGNFSAVSYYFARMLEWELRVPIGIIHSSWGGTPVEAWTSAAALDSVPDLAEARQKHIRNYQQEVDARKDFFERITGWLEAHHRTDSPTPNPDDFAGLDAPTEGWSTVEIPGEIQGVGLPKTGVIWLRKDLDLEGKQPIAFDFKIDGIESIYWNGELIESTPIERFSGIGGRRGGDSLRIPVSKIRQGKNVLAIRFFQPIQTSKIAGVGSEGPVTGLSGSWLAKAEKAFPDLTEEEQASAPQWFRQPRGISLMPAYLFNGMIQPLIPYGLSGVIWYQGENNAGRAFQYRTAFPLLINDWRHQWGQKGQSHLPFYFCQLANYQAKKPLPAESTWAELREAQSLALDQPDTAQAVLIDVGEANDIHPRDKKTVGERLARIALARDYGKSVASSGPVFDSAKFEGNHAVLSFKNITGKLAAAPLASTHTLRSAAAETAPLERNSPDGPLEGFALCGEDRQWVWADARFEGNTVIVSSAKIAHPVAVRYGWADNPTVNLTDASGLPASPFRTDDFPLTTRENK